MLNKWIYRWVVMNVSDTLKNGIAAVDSRREKVQSKGWEEKKYEVSDD